jgi:hypothetical protein
VSWFLQLFPPAGTFGWVSVALQTLAWPAAVVLIAAMFRTEVRLVMERLVRLKFHDFEAQFRRELKESEKLAIPPATRRLIDLPSDSRRIFHEVEVPDATHRQSDRRRPREVIADLWSEVTEAAGRAAGSGANDQVSSLVERGVLAGPSLLLFSRLRRLEALVGSQTDWEPETSDADRFAELARPLTALLRQVVPPAGGDHN